MEVKVKKCTKCRRRKSLTAFGPCERNKTDGRASWCRKCTAKAAAICRLKNPEHYRSYGKQYLRDNPLMVVYKNMKLASVKRQQGKMNITFSGLRDLWKKQNGICYWSGMRMHSIGDLRFDPMAVSADRLNLSKPYSKTNVVLCCRWTNFGRRDTPVSAWKNFMSDKLKLRGLWK